MCRRVQCFSSNLAERIVELDDVDFLVTWTKSLTASNGKHRADVVPLRAHDCHASVEKNWI